MEINTKSLSESSIDNYASLRNRGKGIRFVKIRRITGYLVGSIERFNDGKRAEEKDRVKHCKV